MPRTLPLVSSVAALACAAGLAFAAPPASPSLPGAPDGRGAVDPDALVRALLARTSAPETFGPGGAEVVLLAPACEGSGTLVVEIALQGAPEAVVGGQFFLQYDKVTLDFVSAEAGDAPFTLEIYESVNETLGTIDYAVGVPAGGPGTDLDTVMVRLTFDVLAEVCFDDTLVDFRTHVPPTRITNAMGQEVAASFVDLGAVSLDETPPVVTCATDILVYADAGGCDATLSFVDTLDLPIPICPVGSPDCWEVDRYEPEIFENAVFMGENVLRHGVDVSDSAANRPAGYSSTFYNYQGYKRPVSIPTGGRMSADVWIPSSWDGIDRHASLWGETYDAGGFISGYPILGYTGNPNMGGVPYFRAFVQDTDFDPDNGYTAGWSDLAIVTGFDRWYRFEIELTSAAYEFRVIDLSTDTVVASLSDPITFGSIRVGYVFLQMYNYGDTYETSWDNVALGPDGPSVSDNCGSAVVSYERSDNAALSIYDPFPVGTTTITWTAVDDCGNASFCEQDVVVEGSSLFDVAVALSPTVDAGPFTRCITFEFTEAGCAGTTVVSQELTFVGGLATDVIEVPCGDYVCVTARDELHTLRRDDLDDFGIVGTMYAADFTGTDDLVGGNLNDDAYIDILDFGTFVGEYGANYGTGDTTCADGAPHADIDGDGLVDLADFTFIQIHFLEFAENGCCVPFNGSDGGRLVRGDRGDRLGTIGHGPVRRIAVPELRRIGLGHLAVADLTHDGWLDIADIAAFMGGARP